MTSIWNPGGTVPVVINPTGPVQFVKGLASAPGITWQGDIDTGIWSEADGYLNFSVNGVDVMSISPTGEVYYKTNKWVTNEEVDVASASVVNLGAVTSNLINITGTNNIGSFGTTYKGLFFIRFSGALVLSNTAQLTLPSGANINVAAGDVCIVMPRATTGTPDGWQVVSYTRASGASIVLGADLSNSTRIDVASATNVDLTTVTASATRNINITGVTTITDFTIPIGQLYFVRFAGALTLTNSVTLVTQSGANKVTAAGDTCIIRATAANVVEILCYSTAAASVAPIVYGMKWLGKINPAASANVDFLNIFNSTYDNYFIACEGLRPSADDSISMRFAVAGTVNTTSAYFDGADGASPVSATALAVSATFTTAGLGGGGIIEVQNANDAVRAKTGTSRVTSQNAATPTFTFRNRGLAFNVAAVITGFRLYWNSGSNFAAVGQVDVYGLSKI